MSQHLIDTDRHTSAPAEGRAATVRAVADPRGQPGEDDPGRGDNGAGRGSGTGRGSGNGSDGGRAHAAGAAGAAGSEDAEARASGDPTLRALEALTSALAEMSKDERLLEERLEHLHRQRVQGRSWHEILGEEDDPGTMQLVSRVLACLAKASGTLRKELVDSLRKEGVSIPAIARLFGVTHQRVSNLLRRPAE